MAWINIRKPSVGEATKKASFADAVIDHLAYLYSNMGSRVGGGGNLIPNGGFESDVNADGTPDGWKVTECTAGAFALEQSSPGEGVTGASS
jgi:hypothetical protein